MKMNQIRRSAVVLRSRYPGLLQWNSLLHNNPIKRVSDMGFAAFASSAAMERTAIVNSSNREMLGVNGKSINRGWQHGKEGIVGLGSQFRLMKMCGATASHPFFARSFASKTRKQTDQKDSKTRKEVSTIEDPMDAPTYNIPEKPVTFTEGASYSLIILVGLGAAALAGYAAFKELIFEPKEYKIFNKALKRIQDDAQVKVRIGSPITGYGQETRNRAARQRIPHRSYTDEDGVEHVTVHFYIRGPHGAGKVNAEMFKDKEDKEWKYTYLIVQIMQPSQSQLILESYLPTAHAPVAP